MTQPPGADQPDEGPAEVPSDEEPTTPYPQGHPQADPGYPHPGYEQPGYQQSGYGYEQPGYPPPGYEQPGYGYQQPGYGYQQPGYGYPQGYHPAAPYGIHPQTGIPYSDKSKIVAGLLQVLLPLGIGRMYMGYTGIGVAQLLVTIFTCGVGALWPFVDGIIILVNDTKDAQGRMLRS
jgi:TM2 domain-containing membrane protein YozV